MENFKDLINFNWSKYKPRKAWVIPFSFAKALIYSVEGLALPALELLIYKRLNRALSPELLSFVKAARTAAAKVVYKDSLAITEGYYSEEVLFAESWWEHSLRYPKLLVDALSVGKRRKQKEHKDFSPETQDLLKDIPEYYSRNFHFQTNGYLTEESADLYDHQVEILFGGTADAMRRLLVYQLKQHLGKNHNGQGLKFLELGAGTGSLTRSMALAFPDAKITCVDLSDAYLKKAQQNLAKDQIHNVSFLKGDASQLDLPDGGYDLVYSCYLFHELPEEVRFKVLNEKLRLCKPEGLLGIVDSIQMDDDSSLNLGLRYFPQDFHEPFYRHYVDHPIENILNERNLRTLHRDVGFFTKSILVVRGA